MLLQVAVVDVMAGAGVLLQWVGAGTSPVDWCEDNYTVTPHIAEFVNTVSNVLFLVIPGACMRLWDSYAQHVSRGIHVVWVFFTIVGISSAYFHATLSLLGQLLDELSILWLLMVSYALFTPVHFRPRFLQANRKMYYLAVSLLAILITGSAFVQPAINCYALFGVGSPAIAMLTVQVRRASDPAVKRLGMVTLSGLALAATSWVGDHILCTVLRAIDLAVLHGLWHILIFFSSYNTQVLFCYFHAIQEVPEKKPTLRYWPNRWWGLPYVYCQSSRHDKTP